MTRRIALKLIFPLLAAGIIGTDAWLITITGRAGGFSTAFFIAQSMMFMLLLLLWLYHLVLRRPLKKLATGIDLLREQDFGSRVRCVGQEDADRIAGMFNEMMQHLKQERLHIREQNHFLDLVVEASSVGILVLDNSRRITMANTAAAGFLGAAARHDLDGKPLDCIDEPIARICATLRPGHSEIVRLTDAKIFRCTCSSYMDKGYAHPFLTIEPLTEEMARAERAAYEKVIRMMAHEVNNSMAGVDSILDTACACIDDTELADALRACRRRCRSMSEFITAFASVVKIPEADTAPTDINAFL
ncbi:MAG: PAS domain-containing protein, partial [Muribaculaceae bacterium]|nr:PAS domain-containing protein [Muribaculaceae bacterium]